ncbi:MAG: Ldh family oxidoreductase [Rhizobiaceae bacterium]|nr:MAG: Ldh family oxidoreductase [Rhizobiaceae bacterium]
MASTRSVEPDEKALSLDDVEELSKRVLSRHGLSSDHVTAISKLIVAAERDECASHGVYRLAGLVRTIISGKVNRGACPAVSTDETAIVRVDADGGFSPLAFNIGRPELVTKARRHGIAAMIINRCVHFTALWPEVEALAADGLVSLAMTPSHSWVAPAGGKKALLGTNPFAFAWPRTGDHPYVFDFATSVVARGEVELHRQRNLPIPAGWAVDPRGEPTRDATLALAGALLTFGGYKGSALSTMIELLAGPLIGDFTSAESKAFDSGAEAAPLHGELVIALCPDVFLGDSKSDYMKRAEAFFDLIETQGARLPSQRRFEARERTSRSGIAISRVQYEIIAGLLA